MAGLFFSFPAQAQPLQLYGLADVGWVQTTGLRGGRSTVLASGVMEGSRWGLQGSEDLGGGLRALFQLESRFELDTGDVASRPLSGTQLPDRATTATLMGLPASFQPYVSAVAASIANAAAGTNLEKRLFDRQAFVGVLTPVGGIFFGRQLTPGAEVGAVFDTLQTQSSLSANQAISFPSGMDVRASNTLSYRVKIDHFSASVMHGFGEVAGHASRNQFWGAMAMYRSPLYSLGWAYNMRRNEFGDPSLTNMLLGAAAHLGPGTVSAMVVSVKDSNPTGYSGISASLPAQVGPLVQAAFVNALRQEGRLTHVGYRQVIGATTLYVAYSRFDDHRPANADTHVSGVACTYALSKRTDVSAVFAHYTNKNLAQIAPGQGGFLGGVTAKAGQSANSMAMGLRHRF